MSTNEETREPGDSGSGARRIRNDELQRWIESPLLSSDAGFDEWVISENEFVRGIPYGDLLIFEEDGLFPGKLAFVHQEADTLVFLAPAIKECPIVAEIAVSLFKCARAEALSRGVSELLGIIDSHTEHREILKDSLLGVGFREKQQKVLYRRNLAGPLAVGTDQTLSFKGLDEVDDDTAEQAMSLHGGAWGSLDDFRDAGSAPGRHWKVVCRDRKLVGLSFLNVEGEQATMHYIATAPEARGNGYGQVILATALNHAMSLGATRYLDSTEVSNVPMIRLFERNGCEAFLSRTEYVYLTG
jgi:ribosomal protein S18 acetylase RimI-like enzyme